jgi:hypothetical protein
MLDSSDKLEDRQVPGHIGLGESQDRLEFCGGQFSIEIEEREDGEPSLAVKGTSPVSDKISALRFPEPFDTILEFPDPGLSPTFGESLHALFQCGQVSQILLGSYKRQDYMAKWPERPQNHG